MAQNKVVVFSNGIADLQRTFIARKDQPTEISIPVRTDHVADVLASLNIYGDVTVTRPASFRPANHDAGALSINSEKVLEDLAMKLSGSKVAIDKAGSTVQGVLVGLHAEQETAVDQRILPKSFVVLTDHGLTKVPLRETQRLRFQDAAVQTEIDKALQRNFQKIKPGSTFVDLAVTTDRDETEIVLQYTIPAAAWKISYRLRTDDGRCEFQGFAIVDNHTDEDWHDTWVSIVTGDPITFSTDLADAKIPLRRHVNVVRDSAVGAVDVEEAQVMMGATARGGYDALAASESAFGFGGREPAKMSKRAMRRSKAAPEAMAAPTAKFEEAEAREIGDFCVFESATPVSIGSHRSAVISVFLTTLSEAKTILHFKCENHPERAFRTLRFRNETRYNLARGVCTVFEQGTYGGSCVLPATVPGGECLLPHALEGGVKFLRKSKRVQTKVVGFRLSEGLCYTTVHEKQVSSYHIKNSKDETFEVLLDHEFNLAEPHVTCSLERAAGSQKLELKEQLSGGVRATFSIAVNDVLEAVFTEMRVKDTSVQLVDSQHENYNVHWLNEHLVLTNGPLANHAGIQKCLEIHRSLEHKRQEIADAVNETERLAARQERLRKNLAAGGHDDQTT